MPIEPNAPPKKASSIVDVAINERASRSTFVTSSLRGTEASAFARSMPHRVAYLPFSKIRRGGDLREIAEPAGWRFLIHGAAQEAIAAARVVEKESEAYVLGELSEGAFVSGTEKAIRHAESLSKVKSGRYEAVLLMSPEVYSAALWLQDLDGHDDLVITISTSSSPDSMRAMTPAEFMGKMAVLAEGVRS
jgi:hypothetical protein